MSQPGYHQRVPSPSREEIKKMVHFGGEDVTVHPGLAPPGLSGPGMGHPMGMAGLSGPGMASTPLEVTVDASMGSTRIQIKSVKKTWSRIYKKEGSRGVIRELLKTPTFDRILCLVVVANAVCIALEQSSRLKHLDVEIFEAMEIIFLCIYSSELALHFYSSGIGALKSNWVRFDAALVLTGLIAVSVEIFKLADQKGLMKILVLRMVRLLRLARLARAARLIAKFQELWMLARGLLNSFSTAVHTLMFGCALLFVIGCVTVELVPLSLIEDGAAERNEEVKYLIEENFSSLPMTMLTLVQFITFDNVVFIYKPLIQEDPSLAAFFIVVLLLVGIVFMNLVTAIIVNSGLEQSLQDKNMRKVMIEEKRRQLLLDLKWAFHRIDTNTSGSINRQELTDIEPESLQVLEEYLGVENLPQLFDALDIDGNGEIVIDEFCDGIAAMVLTETQPEVKRIERLAESLHRNFKQAHEVQNDLQDTLGLLVKSVLDMQRRLDRMGPCSPCSPCSHTVSDTDMASRHVCTSEMSTADSADLKLPDWAGKLVLDLKTDLRAGISQDFRDFRATFEAWRESHSQVVGSDDPWSQCISPDEDNPLHRQADRLTDAPNWEVLPPHVRAVETYIKGRANTPVSPPRSLIVPRMMTSVPIASNTSHQSVMSSPRSEPGCWHQDPELFEDFGEDSRCGRSFVTATNTSARVKGVHHGIPCAERL